MSGSALLFSWGANEDGACGHDALGNIQAPRVVEVRSTRVMCASHVTYDASDDGAWGHQFSALLSCHYAWMKIDVLHLDRRCWVWTLHGDPRQ